MRILSGIGYGGLNHYDHNCVQIETRVPLPFGRVHLAVLRRYSLIHSRADYSYQTSHLVVCPIEMLYITVPLRPDF